jgi:hypothetical protein
LRVEDRLMNGWNLAAETVGKLPEKEPDRQQSTHGVLREEIATAVAHRAFIRDDTTSENGEVRGGWSLEITARIKRQRSPRLIVRRRW